MHFLTSSLLLFLFFLSLQAQSADVKEWTFLVFMNADNDLYYSGLNDLAEMEKVGSSKDVNVVVQLDPNTAGESTHRYYVRRNSNPVPGKTTAQVLQDLPETDMGSAQTLSEFLKWGTTNFPAKKYALIIWNHGTGWQGVSYDNNPNNHLTLPELRRGLEGFQAYPNSNRTAPKIDLLSFDACLMSSLEVAFELKDSVGIMVGSQFLVPRSGSDYSGILQNLIEKPGRTAVELAKDIVYRYALGYPDQKYIQYIALDLSKIAKFTSVFNAAAKEMVASLPLLRAQISNTLVNPSYGGFDLDISLKNALEIAPADGRLGSSIKNVLNLYGYPRDEIQAGPSEGQRMVKVRRHYPGSLYLSDLRIPNSIRILPLIKTGRREYSASFSYQMPMQFWVVAIGAEQAHHEARTVILRSRFSDGGFSRNSNGDSVEVIYHDNFPAGSPVIANAMNLQSTGSHGLTLFSLMGAQERAIGHFPAGIEMIQSYLQLRFAQTGAPAWTQFFMR